MDTSSASSDASVSWKSNAAEFDAVAVSAFDALAPAPPTVPLLFWFPVINQSLFLCLLQEKYREDFLPEGPSLLRCGFLILWF